MSESRANLEQILELLLAEENEQAEELLHEYVVAKARQQYERVLDESEEVEEDLDESEEVDEASCNSKKKHEDVEVDETIDHSDPSADYVEDVTAIQDAVEADQFGEGDDEDDGDMDMDMGDDGDVEDKIDDLEDELAALKAEFEKLMSDDDDAEEDASLRRQIASGLSAMRHQLGTATRARLAAAMPDLSAELAPRLDWLTGSP